jgi:hypothetical protein
MANIILRDAGSITSPGSTAKGSPLTNLEVDNNFSNINVTLGVLSNLTTTAQGNLVVAINELVASNATQNTQITLVTTNLATTNSNIGVLSGLTTTNTSNIVFAVNELVTANTTQGTQITLLTTNLATTNSNIGVLSGLTTSNTSNIVSAVNEIKSGNLSQFASTTSAQFASIITDETGTGSVVLSNSPTLVTPALGTPASGVLSSCTVDGTNGVGYLIIPQNSQSTAYTTVSTDSGKSIFHPSTDANARTFTIAANASVPYAIGTVIQFVNMTSQVVTISINSDTMYLAGTGTTGSRSLAQYGVANAMKMTSTTWIITGSGLT